MFLLESKIARSMDLYGLARIIAKRLKDVTIILIMVVAIVATNTFFAQPVYEATSSLFYLPPINASGAPMKRGSGNLAATLSQEELINDEILILTSPDLAKKVIRTVSLRKLYPALAAASGKMSDPYGEATQLFQKDLVIKSVPKSNVITVSFQHGDPEVAAGCVNLLVACFGEKHLQLHYGSQSSFINSQFISLQEKLRESERELQENQRKHGAFSLQEQRTIRLRQRMELDAAYKEAIARIAELQAKIEAIKSARKTLADKGAGYTSSSRNETIISSTVKQLELELKEQETLRKYSESNRLTLEGKAQKEMLKDYLKEEEERVAETVKTGNPVHQQLEIDLMKSEAELSSLFPRAEGLSVQIRELDANLAALEGKDLGIQDLKRRVALNEKNYVFFADKLEEARLSDALNSLNVSNIRVLKSAAPPVEPIKPNKILEVLLAVLLGLLSGVSYAFLSEKQAGKKKHSAVINLPARFGQTTYPPVSHKEGD